MSKKALYLLGILLTILIGTYFFWKQHCDFCDAASTNEDDTELLVDDDKNYSETEPVKETGVDASKSSGDAIQLSNKGLPFKLTDPMGDFSFTTNENFNFNPNGYAINLPVSDELNNGISELVAYFNSNKGKRLNITGLYATSEENTSAYPNLGMARANAVKNYLKERGLKGRFMDIFGNVNDGLSLDETMYRGPILYEILTKEASSSEADELQALSEKINANPLILNFDSGATNVVLTEDQRQKFADIAKYLDKKEGAMVVVTGHTDNTGGRAGNISVGQRRADFAKGYLIQNGISKAKIEATSKGPDEPIASNETEEGKAKNRRTVVTVKN